MQTTVFPRATSGPTELNNRRRLLRVHGTFLAIAGSGLAVYSTVARFTGIGPYAFLLQNPMAWAGLIQAYLLMTLLVLVLLIGSGQPHARKWDVIGALAHVPPAVAVIFSWSVFASLGFTQDAYISLVLHGFWIIVETTAACFPD